MAEVRYISLYTKKGLPNPKTAGHLAQLLKWGFVAALTECKTHIAVECNGVVPSIDIRNNEVGVPAIVEVVKAKNLLAYTSVFLATTTKGVEGPQSGRAACNYIEWCVKGASCLITKAHYSAPNTNRAEAVDISDLL